MDPCLAQKLAGVSRQHVDESRATVSPISGGHICSVTRVLSRELFSVLLGPQQKLTPTHTQAFPVSNGVACMLSSVPHDALP